MKRMRVAGGVLAVVAVVLAGCGGGGDSAATTLTLPSTTVPVDPCDVVPAEPLPLAVTWSADPPLRQGQTTVWTIVVRNTSMGPLAVPFATGKQADIVMRTADDVEVYRYSQDRTFNPAGECRRLPVGASFRITLPEERPFVVAPGTYRLELVVDIAGQPVSQRDFVAVGQPERQP